MKMRGPAPSQDAHRRTPRPPLTRAGFYRVVVPFILVVLAAATGVLVIVVAGLLLGLVPIPGR